MPKWIVVDTSYNEHLKRLRRMQKIGRTIPVRFVAETTERETVVVAPIAEALRLVSTGEITVVSEPLWRLFAPENWCLVQKLLFYLLHNVEFIITTKDLLTVPPENVREESASYGMIDYHTAKPIYEERVRK